MNDSRLAPRNAPTTPPERRKERAAGCAAADGAGGGDALGDRDGGEEHRPTAQTEIGIREAVHRVLDEAVAAVHDLREHAGEQAGGQSTDRGREPARQARSGHDSLLNEVQGCCKQDRRNSAERPEQAVGDEFDERAKSESARAAEHVVAVPSPPQRGEGRVGDDG
jgi:hypothetical protein